MNIYTYISRVNSISRRGGAGRQLGLDALRARSKSGNQGKTGVLACAGAMGGLFIREHVDLEWGLAVVAPHTTSRAI